MKAKTIWIILTLVLLITTMGTALAQEASTQARLAVVRGNDGKLSYVYEKEREDAPAIFGYNPGTFLLILDEQTDGWSHVSIGAIQGYIKTDRLTTENATTATSTFPVMVSKPTNAKGWVNFREEPSLDSAVIATAFAGKEVMVIGENEEWLQVITDGQMGFMQKAFVQAAGKTADFPAMAITFSLNVTETAPQVSAANKPSAANQLLRTYTLEETSHRRHTIKAEIMETKANHFTINIRLVAPADYTVNDDVSQYAVYINGSHKAIASYVERETLPDGGFQDIFTGVTTFNGTIKSIKIIPDWGKGGELDEDVISFRVK